MRNLKEGDSVTINSSIVEMNGKIGKVSSVDTSSNTCQVILEDGNVCHISLNDVTPRSFLTES